MSTPAASQLGHLHDVQIVHVGGITPELIAEARRAGSEVWTYHFSLGHSSPLANRYYAGLYTWGLGVTGNFGWIYFHGGDEYIQPAADDILPKPSYEGLREGINDYRYLRLLEQCLAASQDSPIAEEARAWLDSLRAGADWEFYHEGFEPGHRSYFLRPAPEMAPRDYDRMRARAVEYIQALGVPDPLAQLPAGPASRAAKFEASPFLERSVSECVEGLRSPDMYTRRAAAAALALRGEEGAPAVAELIRQATDPQVRLQAFRALKAIGVAAASAAPVLGEQLEDPDAFVRLGAAYALGGLGEAAVEPLRLALYDGNPSVVQAACAALGRIGPAAASAVPELIVLLGGPSDDPTRHVGELTASHTRAAVEAITGIGPGAAAAVPALVKLYQRDTTGHERRYHPREAEALAAIGPAAAEAIPVLEQAAYSYDWEGLYCLACGASTIYALYVLRGDEADLHALADLLTAPGRHGLKAASLLEKLGERARPAEAKVRSRLEVAREEEDQQMIPLLESILANLAD